MVNAPHGLVAAHGIAGERLFAAQIHILCVALPTPPGCVGQVVRGKSTCDGHSRLGALADCAGACRSVAGDGWRAALLSWRAVRGCNAHPAFLPCVLCTRAREQGSTRAALAAQVHVIRDPRSSATRLEGDDGLCRHRRGVPQPVPEPVISVCTAQPSSVRPFSQSRPLNGLIDIDSMLPSSIHRTLTLMPSGRERGL